MRRCVSRKAIAAADAVTCQSPRFPAIPWSRSPSAPGLALLPPYLRWNWLTEVVTEDLAARDRRDVVPDGREKSSGRVGSLKHFRPWMPRIPLCARSRLLEAGRSQTPELSHEVWIPAFKRSDQRRVARPLRRIRLRRDPPSTLRSARSARCTWQAPLCRIELRPETAESAPFVHGACTKAQLYPRVSTQRDASWRAHRACARDFSEDLLKQPLKLLPTLEVTRPGAHSVGVDTRHTEVSLLVEHVAQ